MFYCFSGTGNSQWVADKLQGLLQDEADVFGMVFPVYAWGIPKVVKEYIQTHMEDIKASKYVWAVITCGDDIGYADTILNNLLGRPVDAVFSVHMPNTYVCLPGFDT
ncbi:MAG: 4Fe-4S ferredoxin, partial [Bacteroidaceae bacterium]|nr:4Fe-4S ferredoxin [Bacteroidaceae bacterium]